MSAKRQKQTVRRTIRLFNREHTVLTGDRRTDEALWQLSVIMAEIAAESVVTDSGIDKGDQHRMKQAVPSDLISPKSMETI